MASSSTTLYAYLDQHVRTMTKSERILFDCEDLISACTCGLSHGECAVCDAMSDCGDSCDDCREKMCCCCTCGISEGQCGPFDCDDCPVVDWLDDCKDWLSDCVCCSWLDC